MDLSSVMFIIFYLSIIFRKSVRQYLWLISSKISIKQYKTFLEIFLWNMFLYDFRFVSYSQTKGSWKPIDLITPRQWPDTAAQFPPESVASWGQGQAVHFATIGLSLESYFTNRYESQFQQKVEIRHQIPSFWDITSNLGPKRFICVYFSYRNAQTWMFGCKYFSDSQDMISVVNLKLQGLGLIPDPRLKTGPFLNP